MTPTCDEEGCCARFLAKSFQNPQTVDWQNLAPLPQNRFESSNGRAAQNLIEMGVLIRTDQVFGIAVSESNIKHWLCNGGLTKLVQDFADPPLRDLRSWRVNWRARR